MSRMLLLCCLLAGPVQALLLDAGHEAVWILPATQWFATDDPALPAEQAAARFSQPQQRTDSRTLNLGLTRQTYWFHFRLEATDAAAAMDWYYHLDWPNLDRIVLYQRLADQWQVVEPVDQYTLLHEQAYVSPRPLFKIALEAMQPTDFLLSIKSEDPMLLAPRLFTARAFLSSERLLFFITGSYFGIILALALYNLFLWLVLKDISYLWYSLSISLTALFFGLNQAMFKDFWPSISLRETWFIISVVLAGMILTVLQFSRSFLLLQQQDPLMDRVTRIIMLLGLGPPLVLLLAPPQLFVRYCIFSSLVTVSCVLLAGLRSVLAGFRPAFILLPALLVFALGLLLHIGVYLGMIHYNLWLLGSLQTASAIEAVLLSIGLAYRIRLLQRERDQLEQEGKRLTQLSLTDGLTGLFNHRYWQTALPKWVALSQKTASPISLLLLDIDHFKQWNDQWGHPAGDAALVMLAKTLGRLVRKNDQPCRLGGEEFAVILPDTDLAAAEARAETIRKAVAELVLQPQPGRQEQLTISLGVASLKPGETAEQLQQRCDQALYQAKAEGRNQVVAG